MHDDPAYYTFLPSASQAPEPAVPSPKHHRRGSLLAQPHENARANGSLLGLGRVEDAVEEVKGPPKATVERRAQSYADFQYAVMAALEPGERERAKRGGEREGPKVGEGNGEIGDEMGVGEWYEGVEEGLVEASFDEYREYLDQLRFTESYLSSISASTTATLDILASLSHSFQNVETQTTAFQRQCEDLMVEQRRLERMSEQIGENLQYYSYLEPITRKLNAPGAGNFVRGKEFSDMLARLDECLEYMNHHMSQREAATYRSRYRQLLTRGLTLIRVNFVGALRDIATDVTKRIADKQLNDTTMSALLYAKFRVGAAELKALAQEIRKRSVVSAGAEAGAEAEYQSLMNELYTSYSVTRGKLILPLITKKIGEIAMAPSSANDLVVFARTSIGYINGICADEYGLWREWFEGEDGLYDFLEGICETLYDHLRPKIIHENQLLKLCELCTQLQTRYFKDMDDEPEEAAPDQLDFSILIQPALEDAQTRLVFKTQAILRDDIENFKPKPADLDYPARNKGASLSGAKLNGPVTSGKRESTAQMIRKDPAIEDEDGVNGKFGFDVESSFQGWYPTLRKAIWLLSRIYRLVNSTIFDDLAHQIVHQTTLSLQRASTALQSSTTPVDAQLFLLKHLLLLKQQIVAFDIEYITPDVGFDFSGMASTFYELRDRGGLFDPRSLWRLVSGSGGTLLPRVVENMLDAKAELDGRLRTVINEFCSSAAGRITAAISAQAVGKKAFDPTAVVPAIQAAAETEVPLLRKKLVEYVDDARTKETLVSAVQDQVVLNYEEWHERWSAERRASGRGVVSSKGKGREGDVWDAGVFSDWALGVFAVGKVYGGERRWSGGSGRGFDSMDGDSGSG